jgi:signal transduction histidine kinase
VFDLFVQGDRSLDRTEGGRGIGLTLTRRLVEMDGGSVAAFSEGPALARMTLVAFTGYGQEDRRRVREAGFDFHLVKPVEVGELTRVIDALPL